MSSARGTRRARASARPALRHCGSTARKARPAGARTWRSAPSRPAVERFHGAGLRAGGRDNGGPGPRPDYGPTYYAAFLVDPDGNNVEAVCMAAAG